MIPRSSNQLFIQPRAASRGGSQAIAHDFQAARDATPTAAWRRPIPPSIGRGDLPPPIPPLPGQSSKGRWRDCVVQLVEDGSRLSREERGQHYANHLPALGRLIEGDQTVPLQHRAIDGFQALDHWSRELVVTGISEIPTARAFYTVLVKIAPALPIMGQFEQLVLFEKLHQTRASDHNQDLMEAQLTLCSHTGQLAPALQWRLYAYIRQIAPRTGGYDAHHQQCLRQMRGSSPSMLDPALLDEILSQQEPEFSLLPELGSEFDFDAFGWEF